MPSASDFVGHCAAAFNAFRCYLHPLLSAATQQLLMLPASALLSSAIGSAAFDTSCICFRSQPARQLLMLPTHTLWALASSGSALAIELSFIAFSSRYASIHDTIHDAIYASILVVTSMHIHPCNSIYTMHPSSSLMLSSISSSPSLRPDGPSLHIPHLTT